MNRRALLQTALLLAAGDADRRSFRDRAADASDYVQRTFWDASAGLYHPAEPRDPKALPYDFMWANGVQFSALTAASRHDPGRYRPLLARFFEGLDRYWDAQAPIPGYDAYWSSPTSDDKYYDDNAWMALALVEAYETTRERRYLERAEAAMAFVLSGWDDALGGGLYWRQDRKSKNTCSNAPAAAALLALARHDRRGERLDWAKRIVAWTSGRLQAPDGTFWDNCNLAGRIERTRWTYNTALMLRSNLGLYRLTTETSYLDEAKRLGRASVKEFVNPDTAAFRDNALFSHLLVEAFLDLHRATREPYLLDHADRNARFATESLRDSDGGYWNEWKRVPAEERRRKEPRKLLMANAATARMLWLVAEG